MMKCFSYSNLFIALLFYFPIAPLVTAVALQNITLPLPKGTSNHGDPNLLCTPTRWTDLISFYLLNYVAHAATVIAKPGEGPFQFAVTVVGCLLFPTIGAFRGIEAILGGAIFAKSQLQKAARTGALCMLVRASDWKPAVGERIQHALLRYPTQDETDFPQSTLDPSAAHVSVYETPWSHSTFQRPSYVTTQSIHGTLRIPDGYRLAIVPPDTIILDLDGGIGSSRISCSYSFVKVVVALAQTSYAATTLYRSRGDQVARYGYAAFGLTVAPYAVMSIVNLIGNLCCPDYPALYLVESSIMDEARQRPLGYFSGTVGRVKEEHALDIRGSSHDLSQIVGPLEFLQPFGSELSVRFRTLADISSQPRDYPETVLRYLSLSDKVAMESISGAPVGEEKIWVVLGSETTDGDAIIQVPSCNPFESESIPAEVLEYSIRRACQKNAAKCRNGNLELEDIVSRHNMFLKRRALEYVLTIFVGLISLIITGAMSHFHPGSSTPTQRSWTMTWLAFGVVSGFSYIVMQRSAQGDQKNQELAKKWWSPFLTLIGYISGAAPAFGGFFVVCQMLNEYGTCVRLG
ncbi:hypothetical protein AOQ84DRAFT_26150 [Glonium stellatum]|uniref:Uncharacterized protein n=1 Tax=Glonium stellatum TaxID=574774 RepID=A0A8E2FCA0_9PEZI|nr:hypothetical protein AOQ84DRAFT_26150 [Glonium stellatum]